MKQHWWQKKSKILTTSLISGLVVLLFAPNLPKAFWVEPVYLFFLAITATVLLFFIKKPVALIFLGFLASSNFLLWRFALSLPIVDENHLSYYYNQKITAEVQVVNYPDARSEQLVLTTKIKKLNDRKNIKGNLLLWNKRWPEYRPGDVLKITCKLESPRSSEAFRYDYYLAAKGIYALCYNPVIIKIDHEYHFLENFYDIRNSLAKKINQGLIDPEAGLAEAMVLGLQSSVSKEWLDVYTKTGIVHMISVSGFHMSILSVIILWLLMAAGLSRKAVFWPIVIFLIFYTLLVGAPAAAVRSVVMAIILLLALRLGRLSQAGPSLILAAFFMALINPWVVSADIGFQLSCLSVFGLVYLSSPIDQIVRKTLKQIVKKESILKFLSLGIATTLATQLMTLPLTISSFGGLSIISLLANLVLGSLSSFWLVLILFVLPLAYVLGNYVFYFWLPILFFGKLINGIAQLFCNLPGAYINNLVWLKPLTICWYVIIFTFVVYNEIKKNS